MKKIILATLIILTLAGTAGAQDCRVEDYFKAHPGYISVDRMVFELWCDSMGFKDFTRIVTKDPEEDDDCQYEYKGVWEKENMSMDKEWKFITAIDRVDYIKNLYGDSPISRGLVNTLYYIFKREVCK